MHNFFIPTLNSEFHFIVVDWKLSELIECFIKWAKFKNHKLLLDAQKRFSYFSLSNVIDAN